METVSATDPIVDSPEGQQLFMEIMIRPLEDPVPHYHRLREIAPVLGTPDGSVVLSRYADCSEALRYRSLGKGDEWLQLQATRVPKENLRQVMELMQRSMILTNPPYHSRLRRVVSSAFTARHVEQLRERVARRVDELLAHLAADPGADLMSEVAVPLPVSVIAELLGIPEQDRNGLVPLIADLGLLMEPAASADEVNRGVAAQVGLADYLTELLSRKRVEPGEDMLSRLVAEQGEDALSEVEVAATAVLLFGAGNTPTSNLIGNGVNLLLTNPEQLRRLREDAALIPSAVEEILRHDSPSQFDFHTVLEPVTLAGADLEPGRTVITLLGAANHDPQRFAEPATFDVGRPENAHLSFAAGIHFCLGAPLARMQAAVFLERLLASYSGIEFAGPARRHPGLGNRGFDELPLVLHPN